jgi:hypothetical protein
VQGSTSHAGGHKGSQERKKTMLGIACMKTGARQGVVSRLRVMHNRGSSPFIYGTALGLSDVTS